MKFVAIIVLTLVLCQVAFAADEKAQEFESSLSSYLQSVAQSAAAQSAAALSAATSESAAAASTVQSSFPATKLESSAAAGSAGAKSESSGCRTFGCGNAGESGITVKDAVQPIEDWIKDFKSRTGGSNNGDMIKAAKMVVHPLLVKLKRTQREALEKLEESDAEIARNVEEKAVEHVYNMLRSENISQKKQEAVQAKKEKIAEAKSEAADKAKDAKMVAESSESSKGSKGSKKWERKTPIFTLLLFLLFSPLFKYI